MTWRVVTFAACLVAASPLLGARCVPPRQTCVQTGGDTWGSQIGLVTDGNLTWDCPNPSRAADFVLTGAVDVDRRLGLPASPLRGSITVRSGGALNLGPGDRLYTDFRDRALVFEAGSDGRWQGGISAAFPAPAAITFPDSTTIRLDFRAALDPDGDNHNENALPWRLCDTGVEDCGADPTSIHREGPEYQPTPATYLYVDWEKAGPAPPDAPVYSPGSWLKVVDVIDADAPPAGDLDTIVVEAPRIGSHHGSDYLGAASGYDGEGRCSECIDDAGRPSQRSVEGGVLRHAVGEAQWTLDATNPWARVPSENGEVRWQIHLDPAAHDGSGSCPLSGLGAGDDCPPFSHDREFEGWLLCRPDDQVTLDPRTETWCARIIRSLADDHDGGGETLVVWKSPEGVLAPGDRLHVYFVRPSPGDRLHAVNPAEIDGASQTTLHVREGSGLCVTDDCRAIRWNELGPDNSTSARGQNSTLWNNLHGGYVMDMLLVENFGGDCDADNPGPAMTCATALKLDSAESGAAPFQDYAFSRVTIQAPDARCYSGGPGDDDRFCARGILQESGDQVYSDGAFRRVRVDFTGTAWGGGYRATGCKNGFLLQDALFLGDRNVANRAAQLKSEELMELRGGQGGCDVDRIALVGHLSGAPAILRCSGCQGGRFEKWVTSLVVFGQAPGEGNPYGNADSAVVVDPATFTPHGALANFATDGFIEAEAPVSYGLQLDHWQSGLPYAIPGWSGCRHTVGLFRIGGLAAAGSRVRGCHLASPPEIRFADNYLANVVLADPSTPLLADYDVTVAGGTTTIEDSLFGFALGTEGSRIFRGPRASGREVAIDRIWHVDPRDGVTGIVTIDAPPATLWLGPNVYTNADASCAEPRGPRFQDRGACIVADELAPDGDGEGRTGIVEGAAFAGQFEGGDVGEGVAITGLGEAVLPRSCANASAPAPGATDDCAPEYAGPRWAGIVAYDWPFAWATLDPVPGFQKPGAEPDPAYLPSYLLPRIGTHPVPR